MVNSSKAKDPRFWERWKESGAIGSSPRRFKTLVENLKTLSSEEERLQMLRSIHHRLISGEAYDWDAHDLFDVTQLMTKNDLEEETDELVLNHNSVIRRDPVRDYNSLATEMPEYYSQKVRSGAILSKGEMKALQFSDKEAVFDRLFSHVTSFGLSILPGYKSPAMKELEKEMLSAMRSFRKVGDFKKLRKKLRTKIPLTQLKLFGRDFYTYNEKEDDSEMLPSGIEYKVAKAVPVNGPRFMVTDVGGYYGFLRYEPEEVSRIAPEEANAFLIGTAILGTVIFNGMWSPIVYGNVLKPIKQPSGEYHIVPIRFFNAEIDRSMKYDSDLKVIARDNNDKPYAWREVVTPRGGNVEVSQDEFIHVLSQ